MVDDFDLDIGLGELPLFPGRTLTIRTDELLTSRLWPTIGESERAAAVVVVEVAVVVFRGSCRLALATRCGLTGTAPLQAAPPPLLCIAEANMPKQAAG
mmetsp:Transcript_46362/g.110401  ORF Transcript_46362/g.110401 Transcript_46362/m.110401 type:complete len:99 (-) Transcript_46362:71-367(-)